jgi:3,4-dihydroxy 2-butanone 4-phosphate synthase/GTP cyclohydrolase II
MPTEFGDFRAVAYRNTLDSTEHLALVMGDVAAASAGPDGVLVRVHSECLTGDILGSLRCDCGAQLEQALRAIAAEGCGAVVYLRGHEGRGIGLGHKIRAYALQDQGLDTVEANTAQGLPVDSRSYGVGAQILGDLGVRRMRLITNNPAKYGGLDGYGLEIVDRVALPTVPTPHNVRYLRTKRDRMNHALSPSLAPTLGAVDRPGWPGRGVSPVG